MSLNVGKIIKAQGPVVDVQFAADKDLPDLNTAIKIDNHQARNMDDVQSLGVIYINHNFATESEATQALNEETDAQGATYYHVILTREPGSNGNMHASADIYR